MILFLFVCFCFYCCYFFLFLFISCVFLSTSYLNATIDTTAFSHKRALRCLYGGKHITRKRGKNSCCCWCVTFLFHNCSPCEFLTLGLAGVLSQESEWQQVFSGLQDSPQYSGWAQQYYSLDGFDFSSYFQILPSFFQAFWNRFQNSKYFIYQPLRAGRIWHKVNF